MKKLWSFYQPGIVWITGSALLAIGMADPFLGPFARYGADHRRTADSQLN
jgi:hypothetical protein